ncbi:MAG: ABC transporter permease [Lachnospiraceae bacterium]|nr:ABC transporter permease [Lachnospiraceae bacterium]
MGYYIKKYYRDILTGSLITFSFALTFFVALNCIRLVNYLTGETKMEKTEFSSQVTFGINLIDPATGMRMDEKLSGENLLELLDIHKGTVMITNLSTIKGAGEQKNVIYVISENDDMPYEVLSGKYPEQDFKNGSAMISKDMMKYTEDKDGDLYLTVNGYYHKVAGILESYTLSGYDETVMVYVNAMYGKEQYELNQSLKQNNDLCQITIGSKSDRAMEYYQQMEEKFGLLDIPLSFSDNSQDGTEEKIYEYLNRIVLPVILLFCIMNIYAVTGIWVRHRLREFAIWKAFGATQGIIMNQLLGQYVKCIAPSVFIGVFLQMIYLKIAGISFQTEEYMTVSGIRIGILIMLVAVAVLYHYARFIKRTEPAGGKAL